MSLKDKIISNLFPKEKGYVKHKSDRGKATKYGITLATAMAHGYVGDMKQLSISKAYEIYSTTYWDANSLDDILKISEKVAEEVFDTGVNMGVKIAGGFLQRALNVFNRNEKDYFDLKRDGIVGNRTIEALEFYFKRNPKYAEQNLLKALNGMQTERYIVIAENDTSQEDFTNGWIRERVT